MNTFEATVLYGEGGWHVEYFREDADGNAWVSYWYGPSDECERQKTKMPKRFHPMRGEHLRDAATATGMYDRY